MTSKKHQNFVSEGMGNKSVRDLPGIGPVAAKRLERRGFHMALQVQGKFMELGNQDAFNTWLAAESKGNSKQVADCSKALEEHRRNFP